MKITLTFERSWNEALWKTRSIHPRGMPAILLTWEPDPRPINGGIPETSDRSRTTGRVGNAPLPIQAFCLLWPIDTTETAITQIQTSLTEHLVAAGFAVEPAA